MWPVHDWRLATLSSRPFLMPMTLTTEHEVVPGQYWSNFVWTDPPNTRPDVGNQFWSVSWPFASWSWHAYFFSSPFWVCTCYPPRWWNCVKLYFFNNIFGASVSDVCSQTWDTCFAHATRWDDRTVPSVESWCQRQLCLIQIRDSLRRQYGVKRVKNELGQSVSMLCCRGICLGTECRGVTNMSWASQF